MEVDLDFIPRDTSQEGGSLNIDPGPEKRASGAGFDLSFIPEAGSSAAKADENFTRAKGTDPGMAARSYAAHKKTDIPMGLVGDGSNIDLDEEPYRQAPSFVKEYIGQDPINAGVSRDDIGALSRIPMNPKAKNEKELSILDSVWKTIDGMDAHLEASKINVYANTYAYRYMMTGDEQNLTKMNDLLNTQKPAPTADGLLESALYTTAEALPTAAIGISDATDVAMTTAMTASSVTGALALGAGPAAPLAEAIGVPASFVGGYASGLTGGYAMSTFRIESGGAFRELMDLRDELGNPIDKDVAKAIAIGVGGLNAGWEVLGMGAILQTAIKAVGGGKILSVFAKDAVPQLIKDPRFKARLADALKTYGFAIAAEGSTEGIQELTTIVGLELAKYISEKTGSALFPRVSPKSYALRVGSAAYAGMEAGAGLGLLGTAVNITTIDRNVTRSEHYTDEIENLSEHMDWTNTKKRSPDHAERVLMAAGHGEDLYVTSEGMAAILEKGGEEGAAVLQKLGIEQGTAENALATGQDVAVSKAKYAGQLLPEERALIQQDIKQAPSSYSLRDTKEGNVDEDSMRAMEVYTEEIDKIRKSDDELVRIEKAVENTGLGKKVARDYSVILSNFARRNGDEGAEFLEKVEIEKKIFAREKTKLGMLQSDKGIKVKGPKGMINIVDDKYVISLFEDKDASTLIHETGHLFLMEMVSVVNGGLASEKTQKDMLKLRKWAGAEEGVILSTEQVENVARGFEAYMLEGVAPTLELAPVFARYRAWMAEIYGGVKNLDVTLNNDTRRLFDELTASRVDTEIASQVLGFSVRTVEQMDNIGMTLDDQAYVRGLVQLGKDNAEVAKNKDMRASRIANRETMLAEATEEVESTDAQDIYVDLEYMLGNDIRINRAEFMVAYGEAGLAKLVSKKVLRNDGVSLREVSNILNYDSVEDMVSAFTSTAPKQEAIELRFRAKLEQHDKAFSAEDYVAATEEFDEYLAIIYKHLIQEQDPSVRPKAVARQVFAGIANNTIESQRVRDAQSPTRYLNAIRKNTREMLKAERKKDFLKAQRANERVRLNQQLARASISIREEVSSAPKKAKKAARAKSVDVKYRDTIRILTQTFGLSDIAPEKSEAAIPLSRALARDVDGFDEGFPASDFLLREAPRDFKDLTVIEFREVMSAINYLKNKGRSERSVVLDGQKISEEQAVALIVKDAEGISARWTYDSISSVRKISDTSREAMAMFTPLSYITTVVGGFQELGKDGVESNATKLVFNPLVKATDDAVVLNESTEGKLSPYITQLTRTKRALKKAHGERIIVGEENVPALLRLDGQANYLTTEQIYAMALNRGNVGNYQRLKDGYDMSDAMVDNALSYLGKEDWDAIQGIWDTLDSLFPEIDAVHTRLYNYHLVKVEPTAFKTPFGVYKGGYYPAHYDGFLRGSAALKVATFQENDILQMKSEAVRQIPAVKSGMVKGRVDGVKLPLKLSLSVIHSHVKDAVMYITHAEAVRSVDRLTMSPEFQRVAEDTMGLPIYRTIRSTLKHIAHPNVGALELLENRWVAWAKGHSTAYILGLNASVALKQPFSLAGGVHDIGLQAFARGIQQVATHPLDSYFTMRELSPYMRDRGESAIREIRDSLHSLTPNQRELVLGKKVTTKMIDGVKTKVVEDRTLSLKDVQNAAFWPIRIMDTLTVLPLWWGKYLTELKSNGGNVSEAVRLADAKIRASQPSAQPIDVSYWQRAGGAISLFSNFQTFTMKHLTRRRLHSRALLESKRSGTDYAWYLAMDRLIPMFLLTAFMAFIHGDDLEDEEVQKELAWETGKRVLFTGVPIVEQLLDPVYGRITSPVLTAFDIIQDAAKGGKEFAIDPSSEKGQENLFRAAAHAVSFLTKVPVAKVLANAEKGAKQTKYNIPYIKYLVPRPLRKDKGKSRRRRRR